MKSENDPHLQKVMKRIDKVMMYTVPDGKKFRGMTIVKCFKSFAENEFMVEKYMKQAFVLGWYTEIVQAAFLVYDDIMDHSVTRRGKRCWYLHNNNGVKAINDAPLLRFISLKLLCNYLRDHPCYLNIFDVTFSIFNATMFGQVIDGLTTPEGKRPDFTLLNDSRYETIVKYKTSYYTFVMPVRYALYLAELDDANLHADVEKLLLRIGHLFQVQDDFLDIYGDPKVTGKIGTDIADGKCNWISVQAYKKMDSTTKKLFEYNYGLKQRVQIIKDIFDELKMRNVFEKYEEKENVEIGKMISKFEENYKVNGDSMRKVMKMIYKRKK